MKTILLLEDNDERIAGFQSAVTAFGPDHELKVWREAPSMIAECEKFFSTTVLISLDHDLNPEPGVTTDPGTGLQVAQFLADFLPVCPLIIHSSNTDRAYSMLNELRFAHWMVDRVGPIGNEWIGTTWVRIARELIAGHPNTWTAQLPSDHEERVERMKLSLDGLGLGDALGEMLSYQAQSAPSRLAEDRLPGGPWFHTDDTEMAISIVHVIKSHGNVNRDALAHRFARRYERDPMRGYGTMTAVQMQQILGGENWRKTSASAFGGLGSMGNGGAMRVAPLGAYFAGDLDRCASEARASSLVTHTHPDGVAGTIAVALAAAVAWQMRDLKFEGWSSRFFDEVIRRTPESEVRLKLVSASRIPATTNIEQVALVLGNGSLVTAPDTVPFCVWVAAHQSRDFKGALAQAIQTGGDCDTNAAIVGGIVALSAGRDSIPADWLEAREPVQF